MNVIVISRKSIESNIENAVGSCCIVAAGGVPERDAQLLLYKTTSSWGNISVLCLGEDEIMTQPVLIIPIPIPRLFTWLDPIVSMERLRPFFRGLLKSAVAIWSKDRKQGIDFDQDGIFYRRPFSSKDDLWHQTLVLVDCPHHAEIDKSTGLQDLVIMSFGHAEEGLPRLENFKSACEKELESILSYCKELLTSVLPGPLELVQDLPEKVTHVTSLKETRAPAWLSFSQWMNKLEGSSQESFIKSPLTGPQRVDGPAGSGKTLSLVLKCLYTLKEAAKRGESHHSAFVVFSTETKQKIIESFLAPLDEDGFYLRERSPTDLQSLTLTTLLEWSQHELAPIVGAFNLPSDNAAQARIDQHKLVIEVLENNLNGYLKGGGSALSHELRELCGAGVSPVLVGMFQHEFGVVIKGMADGSLRRYLAITRPTIALPCSNEADRRFVFALFEKYEDLLQEYAIVDLDDVAVSHIKLLQMPLRREARQKLAFDSVFVDEAHSFNPNELSIFFLLTRRSELPPLVVAVDLPQALGDKAYEGTGLEQAIFEEVDATGLVPMTRFSFQDVKRCPQTILDLVASIYVQGHQFLAPIRVPNELKSMRTDITSKPMCIKYQSQTEMLEGIFEVAESIVARLRCSRSEILIVLMHDGLETNLPQRLISRSEVLSKRTDLDCEHRAQKLNHFMVGRPEYLHGLDFEAVIIVGASRDEIPRFEHGTISAGAAAMFETQRVIDLLYLSLTRVRSEAAILYVRAPTFLLNSALEKGLLEQQG